MKLIIILLLTISSSVFSQNMVPNSSFEEINDTIGRFTKDNIDFKNKIKNWESPNTASPDLITPDFEEKFISAPTPRTGSNSIGIQASKHKWENKYWSEYVGVQLTKPMIAHHLYHVEYYIRRAICITPSRNKDEFLKNNFGILFTTKPINSNSSEMLTGDDVIQPDTSLLITKQQWVKISKYFTAKESYNFLYLGQFRDKNQNTQDIFSSYYVIDDISVTAIDDIRKINKGLELPIGSIIPLKNVHFLSGTTQLSDKKSHKVLNEVVGYLNANPLVNIRINGHTDAVGNENSNLKLSEDRAKVIAQIISEKGIHKNRIKWKGFGEKNPIANNDHKEGRSKNRRVEFEVIE